MEVNFVPVLVPFPLKFCLKRMKELDYCPQTKFWGKVIFLHQFVILFTGGGGMRGCLGGMRGCSGGGCVWFALGGHVWLLPGGHVWCLGGACVVARGGMHGCSGAGHAWLLQGGCAWLLLGGSCMVARGGMCGCSGGGVWLLPGGHAWFFSVFFGYNEIRSMSGRYASYWNAFLFVRVSSRIS